MQRATWNWSRNRQKESPFKPKETKRDSRKNKEPELREDKLRSSSLLRVLGRLTLTINSWMRNSEILLQGMSERLSTGRLHLYNYANSLLGDLAQLYTSRK